MEKLTTSLKEEFDNLYPLSDDCWICKVPPRFRHVNERLFTPQRVSIGPIHHGREELKDMEEHKIRYLHCFLQRTEVSMEDFLVFVKEREQKLRHCYAETIKFASDDFIKMILVDAVFVIELFLRDYIPGLITHGDRLFRKPNMLIDICPDLVLLENQLPIFIFDDLFTLAKTSMTSTLHYEGLSIVKLISEFFASVMGPFFLVEDVADLIETHFSQTNHFLDLLRLPLKITESLFRNLQVFEQLHCEPTYINDYIIFMNYLVNSLKDVELLVRYGIIENNLEGSQEVCTLFHNLLNESLRSDNDNYYSVVAEDLLAYWKSPWRNWKANLKQNYFNTPWTAISVAAAIILFVLTFIQTYDAIVKN